MSYLPLFPNPLPVSKHLQKAYTLAMDKVELIQSRRNLKPVVITVGVALGLLVVGCTIFLSVFMTRQHDKLEWVGFNGGFHNKQGSMHEESEIDPERRTILHVNAEGWRVGINNSVSLHDYNNGLLATRLMETGTCMIIELIDTYEEAAAMLHQFKKTGVSIERPVREFDSGSLIPQERLVEEIGARLANFCRSSPTYRLHEVPAGTLKAKRERQRRRVLIYEPVYVQATCVGNEFCCEESAVRSAAPTRAMA